MKLFGGKGKTIPAWSQRKGYRGGHRAGTPKKGSQYRKHTLRGALFGRGGSARGSWLWN